MSKICILTDPAVQFPFPNFPGRNLVYQVPVSFMLDGKLYEDLNEIKAAHFPGSILNGFEYSVLIPEIDSIKALLQRLAKKYEHIFLINQTRELNPLSEALDEILNDAYFQSVVTRIDSQTTSIGLGILVQKAAAMAEEDASLEEIENEIRAMIIRTYSVFCIEGMSYLHRYGMISKAQAYIGEKTKMLPFFTIEEGVLTPTEKARNYRHLVDVFFEFLFEFPHLEHIAIIQGAPAFDQESRLIRERILEEFEDIPISEHIISPILAAVIGPRSLGIINLQAK